MTLESELREAARNKALEEVALWHDAQADGWEKCYQDSHKLGLREDAMSDLRRKRCHLDSAAYIRALKTPEAT